MAAQNYSWQVTDQVVNQTIADNANNVIVGTYVYYQTGDGNKGVVFIPDAQYSVDFVHTQVRISAKLLDDVGRLSGEYKA